MATVTGLTAERMLAIEAASVVDGDVIGDNLILTKHDGSQINAGSVRGPQGPAGPTSSDLSVIMAKPVLDVGFAGQIRAGRQLTAVDFTNMGLSIPLGLWNLSDLSDASGNGRALSNKGAVPFDVGINGTAATAAKFAGLVTQALYISDTGAADPFRIRSGSWGCWFKTLSRGRAQGLMGKNNAVAVSNFAISILPTNVMSIWASDGVASPTLGGTIDVCDDKWHFAVGTSDGTMLRLYVDCMLDLWAPAVYSLNPNASAPLNIGGYGADASNANGSPSYSRIDEAFVTSDVLTEDQIRNLYCTRIPHTLGAVPSRVTLNIRRRRRNPVLAVADFTTQPIRMYNFSAGSLADEGSGAVNLVNNGAASPVGGVDGVAGNAFSFNGTSQYLSSTDASLPLVLADRSYGCWFKMTDPVNTRTLISWGTSGQGLEQLSVINARIDSGVSSDHITGPQVVDGNWHHVVVVETNNLLFDGSKRRMYVDGVLVGNSVTTAGITPGGANAFRIGCLNTGAQFFLGQIDSVFVTNYVMSSEEVFKLYQKGTQTLPTSPKNHGDHVEALTAADVLAVFDTLDNVAQVDLGVAA